MISLRGVYKTFTTSRGATAALSGLDLEIARGEFVCLIGPSGCGKTTLLNLIAGLEPADAGQVLIEGRPVDGPGRDRGVMFQDAALFPWLTVEQNIQFGMKAQRIARRIRQARTAHYLEVVGMSAFRGAYVHELSGGMRQRVALARALALEPAILLMDEPFGSLDPRTRDALQEELDSIWRSTAKTIVFVTHDMSEAVRLGSRVIVLAARPARVRLSVDVEAELPRPRLVDQPAVVALAARLKQGLDSPEEDHHGAGPDRAGTDRARARNHRPRARAAWLARRR